MAIKKQKQKIERIFSNSGDKTGKQADIFNFINNLGIEFKRLSKKKDEPLKLEVLLEILCKALEASWATVLYPQSETSKLVPKIVAQYNPEKKDVIAIFKQHSADILEIAKGKPDVLDSFEDSSIKNIAVIPFEWILRSARGTRILLIGDKKNKTKVDLPYYTTESLLLIQFILTLGSSLVEANIKMEFDVSKRNWEQSLYSGTRWIVKRKSEELENHLNQKKKKDNHLSDEVKASKIDADLSLEIIQTQKANTTE